MSVKLQIIRKSIASCDRKIAKIRALMEVNPASDIIDGRRKFQEIVTEHKGDHETIAMLLEPLAKREKELFSIAKKQEGMHKDGREIDQLVALESERRELVNELHYTENRCRAW